MKFLKLKIVDFFAILDLTGHHHAGAYSNIRFYYNPYTSKLEPIGYDNQYIQNLSKEGLQIEFVLYDDLMNSKIFRNELFLQNYVQSLKKISDKDFLDSFFMKNDSIILDKLNVLYKDYPNIRFNAKEILYQNQLYIRKKVNSVYNLFVYKLKSDKSIDLSILNIQALPLEIIGLKYNDSLFYELNNMSVIPSKNRKNKYCYYNLSIDFDDVGNSAKNLELAYKFWD